MLLLRDPASPAHSKKPIIAAGTHGLAGSCHATFPRLAVHNVLKARLRLSGFSALGTLVALFPQK
nr:MAG: hypothetical protein DIU68_17905 [Chloroflexota bacterium]